MRTCPRALRPAHGDRGRLGSDECLGIRRALERSVARHSTEGDFGLNVSTPTDQRRGRMSWKRLDRPRALVGAVARLSRYRGRVGLKVVTPTDPAEWTMKLAAVREQPPLTWPSRRAHPVRLTGCLTPEEGFVPADMPDGPTASSM